MKMDLFFLKIVFVVSLLVLLISIIVVIQMRKNTIANESEYSDSSGMIENSKEDPCRDLVK